MATDYSSLAPGGVAFVTRRVAMDATAGNAEAVTLPSWCKRITVYFTDSSGSAEAGKLADSGTDGAAIGNDHVPIPSGVLLQERVQPGVIYLAGTSNGGYCHLMMSAYEIDGRG